MRQVQVARTAPRPLQSPRVPRLPIALALVALAVSCAASGTPTASRAQVAALVSNRVDVYYFHRTIRCVTCLTFESYAHEALLADHAGDLASGRLTWSVLNYEDEANAELVDRYDVFESSLVVSSVRDSVEVAWEKLEAIWGLVSDRSAYIEYVSAEVDTARRVVAHGDIGQEEDIVPVHR